MPDKLNKKKRIRYKIPKYKKVYSVYQYDRQKYSSIYKKLHLLALKYSPEIFYRVNPYKVLKLCYIKDEFKMPQSMGDEKHIFRYKALENILKEIADILIQKIEVLPEAETVICIFKNTCILIYYPSNADDRQAEILETINKPIKTRIKEHITLLKELKFCF